MQIIMNFALGLTLFVSGFVYLLVFTMFSTVINFFGSNSPYAPALSIIIGIMTSVSIFSASIGAFLITISLLTILEDWFLGKNKRLDALYEVNLYQGIKRMDYDKGDY